MGIKGDKRKVGLILSGQPLPIQDANIYMTQPTIQNIVLFGEDDFFAAINIIINLNTFIEQIKQGNSELTIISDFQLLLMLMEQDSTIKTLINSLFSLVFPNYEIEVAEQAINFFITQDEKRIMVGRLHPFNFEFFQTVLSDAFIPVGDEDREPEYNPANELANKIAEKIKEGRAKIHAMQAEQEGEKSLYGQYASVLSIGMHMDVNIFYNYTPFQLYDAYRRFFSKEASDYYRRIASMPMMDVSKIEEPPD